MSRANLRVLVAEDDCAVAETLRDVLLEHGCAVCVVGDGGAALAALSLVQFDVVLTDLSMPRMSGCKLVLAMRRRGISIPIIVVSARPDTADLAGRLGVRGYLMKPFDIDELVDKVRCAAHRRVRAARSRRVLRASAGGRRPRPSASRR